MLFTTRDEVQKHFWKLLDARHRGDSPLQLVLIGLAEELKVYRIRLDEEREKHMRTPECRSHGERGSYRERLCNRHRKDSNQPHRDRSARQNRTKSLDRQPKTRTPDPKSNERSRHVMSGALPPGTTLLTTKKSESDTSIETKPHHPRRRRSPPMPPPPSYRLKLGPTLGSVTHYWDCVKYVAEERAKKTRRRERRAQRNAREEAEALSTRYSDTRSSKHFEHERLSRWTELLITRGTRRLGWLLDRKA